MGVTQKRAGRHFGLLKRAGRHQQAAGRPALRKRPRQNTAHVSLNIQNLQVSSYVLMYLRAFRTYKSVVMYSYISEHSGLTNQWLCTHVSQSSQKLQVSSYVLMYLRAVRTYKSVVMYSCISEHAELTSQWLCTHAFLSIQNLQVSSYVLMYLRAFRTCNDFPTC